MAVVVEGSAHDDVVALHGDRLTEPVVRLAVGGHDDVGLDPLASEVGEDDRGALAAVPLRGGDHGEAAIDGDVVAVVVVDAERQARGELQTLPGAGAIAVEHGGEAAAVVRAADDDASVGDLQGPTELRTGAAVAEGRIAGGLPHPTHQLIGLDSPFGCIGERAHRKEVAFDVDTAAELLVDEGALDDHRVLDPGAAVELVHVGSAGIRGGTVVLVCADDEPVAVDGDRDAEATIAGLGRVELDGLRSGQVDRVRATRRVGGPVLVGCTDDQPITVEGDSRAELVVHATGRGDVGVVDALVEHPRRRLVGSGEDEDRSVLEGAEAGEVLRSADGHAVAVDGDRVAEDVARHARAAEDLVGGLGVGNRQHQVGPDRRLGESPDVGRGEGRAAPDVACDGGVLVAQRRRVADLGGLERAVQGEGGRRVDVDLAVVLGDGRAAVDHELDGRPGVEDRRRTVEAGNGARLDSGAAEFGVGRVHREARVVEHVERAAGVAEQGGPDQVEQPVLGGGDRAVVVDGAAAEEQDRQTSAGDVLVVGEGAVDRHVAAVDHQLTSRRSDGHVSGERCVVDGDARRDGEQAGTVEGGAVDEHHAVGQVQRRGCRTRQGAGDRDLSDGGGHEVTGEGAVDAGVAGPGQGGADLDVECDTGAGCVPSARRVDRQGAGGHDDRGAGSQVHEEALGGVDAAVACALLADLAVVRDRRPRITCGQVLAARGVETEGAVVDDVAAVGE